MFFYGYLKSHTRTFLINLNAAYFLTINNFDFSMTADQFPDW